jgi:hypothetical protein
VCVFGTASFADHKLPDGTALDIHQTTSIQNYYCSCQQGWTGVACDVRWERCSDTGDDNDIDAIHHCYNGGACIPGLTDKFGNDQLYCDCQDAMDDNGNRYVGKYCEQFEDNDACDPDDADSFCVNEGICNPDYPLSGENCLCRNGFAGPHCEYRAGDVPTCDLDCQNQGRCVLGNGEMQDDDDDDGNDRYQFWDHQLSTGMYCDCPENYDGPLCEILKEPCGDDFHCFHGGHCVARQVNEEWIHHCDCSLAGTGATSYAGRYCQYEATSYCTKDEGLNGHLFCVNHGTCADDPYQGCDCLPGFTGFSCEFVSSFVFDDFTAVPIDAEEDDEFSNIADEFTENFGGEQGEGRPLVDSLPDEGPCTLPCENGGVCRNGVKDVTILDDLGAQHLNRTHINYEHCVCDDGFVGAQCEHQIQICGDGEHLCLHGGTCVTDNENHACDCSTTDSTLSGAFGGKSCQHPANDICTIGEFSPMSSLSFCVNGGVCAKKVTAFQEHPGCSCEIGWAGPHCELREDDTYPFDRPMTSSTEDSASTVRSNTASPSQIFAILFSTVAIIAFAVFAGIMYRRRRMRNNDQISTSLRWSGDYRDEPPKVNIAPRSQSGEIESSDVYFASIASPNRDPMATHLAPHHRTRQALDTPHTGGIVSRTRASSGSSEDGSPSDDAYFVEDEEPKIFIGPPRDEDGHELHNVEIV